MVVDADGLNALSQSHWSAGGAFRVLTPHPGEMSRLLKTPVKEIEADRVAAVRSLATGRRVCVVLKGEHTLTAFPDGRVAINPTGTPALATGGVGDILTGLIAGFLAQFPQQMERAVIAAVYLHGLAGNVAARRLGMRGLIAGDIVRALPAAIMALESGALAEI